MLNAFFINLSMRYAIKDNIKIEATKGIKDVVCECCNQPVKPCCGQININHFRHLSKKDCDNWYEPMTQWHLDWQNKFPENCREIVISKKGVVHRADVLNNKGTVIEFQKSFIKPTEIKEREMFYDKMIWVFSGIEFRKNFNLKFSWTTDFKTNNKQIKAYNWTYPKKHIFSCQKPVFIDFGTDYMYWINFLTNEKRLFRSSYSSAGDEYYDTNSGDYRTYYETETEYFWYPIRLIRKDLFLSHYSV